MVIEQLLGDLPKRTFVEEYYLKLPFSLPGRARPLVDAVDWGMVEAVLDQPDTDVLVVREGKRWEGEKPPTPGEARALYDAGHTIVIRNAQRHDPALSELAEGFHADFRATVNIHIYCTPSNQHGFGWHYDAEDVFILQAGGSKQYQLRKNSINPWPLVETIPPNMRFEREIMPLLRCTLEAGDWLYIPGGYWHVAQAEREALSLAVGVMSTSAMDVFDFLRGRLLGSLCWRQRLPTPGEASPLGDEELLERYRDLFAELGEELKDTITSEPFLRAFLATKGRDAQA